MSYGLATISTNAGGIPQIISQGIDGYRGEAGDLKELETTLVRVLICSNEKKILGQAARKKIVEKFNAERNIDLLCALYQKVGMRR